MSASERLRALDGAWREAIYFQRKTGIPFQIKAALPLIADVVEAAEKCVEHYVHEDQYIRLAVAMKSLQEHLEGQ